MILKRLIIGFVIIFQTFALDCYSQKYQFTSLDKTALKYYQEAENAYKTGNYKSAKEYLGKSIKSDNKFIEAFLLLGDVCSELGQNEKAIEAYSKAIDLDAIFFPPAYYFLGNLYFKIGKYKESLIQYEKFLKINEISKGQKELAFAGAARSLFALKQVENPGKYWPENVGKPINTPSDEYINFINEFQNQMFLTRKNQEFENQSGNSYYSESLYTSTIEKNAWKDPQLLNLSWKQGLDLGGLSLSVDGRKMYFTGCNWPENFGSCDIFFSFKKGISWQSPVNAGAEINSQWWDSQPYLSADGRTLYFASKRAGGKGGSDIWKSVRLKTGKWSSPINLGDSINTVKDEMAPYIHPDGKTMYFSSNGWPGMGGFDLFISQKNETGQWSAAENLGYPLNSNKDEINIFIGIDGENAWYSSNKEGGEGGFDIYKIKIADNIKPNPVFFVKGIVADKESGKALQANVELTDLLTGVIVDSVSSDIENGEFLMVLHPGNDYAFNINSPAYLFYSENFNLKDSLNDRFVEKKFELILIKQGNSIILNNIFFEFNSSELLESSQPELGNLAELLIKNENLRIEINGHTDNIGDDAYNIQLSTDRARAVYSYLIDRGIDPSRLKYSGYGSAKPLDTNETETGRAKNRRTEIVIL